MIDIDMDQLSINNYTATLLGNTGEEQLIIIYSPSQALKGPVMIVRAQCDGKVELCRGRTTPSQWVPDDEFQTFIYAEILRWASGGIKPTEAQLKTIASKAADAAARISRHFNPT